MPMTPETIVVTPAILTLFRNLKRRYLKNTLVPKPSAWRTWSDNDVWLHVVCQVAVVGGSVGWDRLSADPASLRTISWRGLAALTSPARRTAINGVLRLAAVRFVSADFHKCAKTTALAHNYSVLTNSGGPKRFIGRVAELSGPNASLRRIAYLMKTLRYFKSQSARDFLMELGLLSGAIAFDVRVRNVLSDAGLVLPSGFEARPERYNDVERQVLERLCRPLGLTGIQFDRLVYQNYEAIRGTLAG